MKDKLKKQRKIITIKITAVLLAVWILVSLAFSTAVLLFKKEELLYETHNIFNSLCNCLSSAETTDKYTTMIIADLYKVSNSFSIKPQYENIAIPEIKCGADGYYDSSIQIKLSLTDEDMRIVNELIDTDKDICVHTYAVFESEEKKFSLNGYINHERFSQSITKEQLDSISKYLHIKKDKNGDYYELICKKFYYDEGKTEFIPKTVEIVKTNESHTWYAQDEVVETYELSPLFTDDFKLFTSSPDSRNVIPGQFVLGTFSSGNLIDSYDDHEFYPYAHSAYGNYAKIAPFTYIFKNHEYLSISEESYDEPMLYGEENSNTTYYDSYAIKESVMLIEYAKQFNILDSCKYTLIFGVLSLLLFFFIIGVILSVMMCKISKTQEEENEKRREITNALAHDIKTPLFIISGYAQNLKEKVNTDKRDHYCDRIINRTKEVNELVHKMLDLSKLDSLKQVMNPERVDIADIISLAIEDYSTLPDGKLINATLNDCEINADRALISRAVSYLLENAVKYSDNNTSIDITLNEDSLSISNKCFDITSEDIPHLTEPYFRVEKNRESKGNGLGLSIVKSIVDMHDFKLDIKLNNNTITFKIVFHN